MKADRNYYLKYRHLFQMMNLHWEVKQLDIHFKVYLLRDKRGQLIKIL